MSVVTLPVFRIYVRRREVRRWQEEQRARKRDVEAAGSEASNTTTG